MAEVVSTSGSTLVTVYVPGPQGPKGNDGLGDPAALDARFVEAKNRSSHQGTQMASTIEDLTTAVRSIAAAYIAAGANVTVAESNGLLTISSTGGAGTGTLDVEGVQDIVGAMTRSGTGVTVTYDDPSGLLTISAAVTSVAGRAGDVVLSTTDLSDMEERVEDTVAAMIAAGTHSGVTITYADNGDGRGTLSFTAAGGTGGVSQADLTNSNSSERNTSNSLYTRKAEAETISGAWDFTTEPRVNGVGITSNTIDQTARDAATNARTVADSKYLKPTAGIPSTDLTSTVQGQLTIASSFDFTTTAPADGDLAFYDSTAGKWVPGPAPQPAVDKYVGRFAIVDPGTEPPSDFGAGMVFERTVAAGAALSAVDAGKSAGSNVSTLTITLTTAFAVGDYLVLAIANSGETSETAFTAAVNPVSTSGIAKAVTYGQGLTVQSTLLYGKVTTAIAAGATVTINAKDAATNTNVQSRNDLAAKAIKLTGLAGTSVLDQQAVNGAGNTVSPTVATANATSQAAEIALVAYAYNDLVLGFAAGAGWTELGTKATSADASPRAIVVQYKVLNSAATVSAAGSFTRPAGDTTSSTAYAGVLQTFKGA